MAPGEAWGARERSPAQPSWPPRCGAHPPPRPSAGQPTSATISSGRSPASRRTASRRSSSSGTAVASSLDHERQTKRNDVMAVAMLGHRKDVVAVPALGERNDVLSSLS